jgi:hypothetical protein
LNAFLSTESTENAENFLYSSTLMMRVKKTILVAIPPLVTVLLMFYAWYRHRNPVEPSSDPVAEELEYSGWDQHLPESEAPTPVENPSTVAETSPPSATEEATVAEPVEQPKLSLEDAESRIVELASPLSDLPLWQKILGQSRPLQRFVAALDAIALGKRPLEPLDFLRPETGFSAEKQGRSWRQNAASKERFSGCVELFCSVSPAAAAKLYRFLEPALQEACNNLGYRDRPVQNLLTEAFTVLLSTPILEEEPLLTAGIKPGIYYWQNPELEKLNDAQKLFLRLGNQNVARVRSQLEAIAAELQLYQ